MKRTSTWLRMSIVGGALLLGACATDTSSPQTTAAPTTTTTGATTTTETTTAPAPKEAAIAVQGFLFDPDMVTVSAGTQVTWTNSDRILHTVTAGTPDQPERTYDGQLDGAGSTFAITYDQPGAYDYFCARHPHMTGTIVVE